MQLDRPMRRKFSGDGLCGEKGSSGIGGAGTLGILRLRIAVKLRCSAQDDNP
jgi:hypothetical protein